MWSHKILRWLTPFSLILNGLCCIYLSFFIPYFWILGIPVILFFVFPLLHALLRKIGIKNAWLDAFHHFVMMNFALLKGTFDYFFAPKTSIWERTQRA